MSKRYNGGFMTRDTIKYIAAFTMLLNHIGTMFCAPPLKEVLQGIGYFAAITMCYFLVEGYRYTRSIKKYGLRLLVFALISQIPYSIALTDGGWLCLDDWNMIANLFLCFLIIHTYYMCDDPQWKAIIIAGLVAFSFFCDWSCLAPAFVLFFLWAGTDRKKQVRAWTRAILLWGGISFLSGLDELSGLSEKGYSVIEDYLTLDPAYYLWPALLKSLLAMTGPIAAAVLILYYYNGKRSSLEDPRLKAISQWFFYVFYPGHLLILGLCAYCGNVGLMIR